MAIFHRLRERIKTAITNFAARLAGATVSNTEVVLLLACLVYAASCDSKPEQRTTRKTKDYIREIPGTNDSIPADIAERGKVLIAYSDCYTCHKEDERSVGPAFKDVAKRYPVKRVYIDMLAQRIIVGGSRSWGYAQMDPHPKLPLEDAKAMVTYILSLDQ